MQVLCKTGVTHHKLTSQPLGETETNQTSSLRGPRNCISQLCVTRYMNVSYECVSLSHQTAPFLMCYWLRMKEGKGGEKRKGVLNLRAQVCELWYLFIKRS